MQFTLIPEERRSEWNKYIAESEHSSFTQSYEWGTVKSGTWRPFYTAVTDADQSIRAAALVLKRTFPAVPHSIMYCPRGPLFLKPSQELVSFYFDSLKLFAKTQNAVLFRCDPEIPETDEVMTAFFRKNGLKYIPDNIQPRATIILDLHPDEDALLQSFHHKTRYNIRLAQKKGVTVREAETPEDIDAFYDLFRITGERDRFLILQKSYFHHLWNTLRPRGMGAVFIASVNDKPVAAIFQAAFGDKMTYVYGASSNEFRNYMPNHLIHWHAILWAKSRGMKRYDFWGIPAHPHEQHPLWGVYRFKKGFCEQETRWIGTYEIVYKPLWKGLFTAGARIFKTTVRFLRTGSFRTPLDE